MTSKASDLTMKALNLIAKRRGRTSTLKAQESNNGGWPPMLEQGKAFWWWFSTYSY